jgi:hypothetical protein
MQTTQPKLPQQASPDPENVTRLLRALGEWGAAEVRGEPQQSLETFAQRAMTAYRSLAQAA